MNETEPIAIVGMGCRFPGGVHSPEVFWQLLRQGVDAISEVPSERWDIDAFYDPNLDSPETMNTRWGGFLKNIDKFDSSFFEISSREASAMDPQQRLLLEVSWEALENAGIAPEKLAGSQTGVFIGTWACDYYKLLQNAPSRAGTGLTMSITANRLSYFFDLRGPSMSVDTACSSSLVAVHMACQSLQTGDSNLVLAGGVNVILAPDWTITFSQAGMMAADGRCKSFDARADGYVRGEGCGIVVLKRLCDASLDGDNVLAVLRGSAVNQDGRGNGLTVPNVEAQKAVIRQALTQAQVSSDQIDYVEAHGTGTPLGDSIELQSLTAVLGERRSPEQPFAIGSAKTVIGHLEAAAGIAGFIKAILCLQHGEIPPHPHLKELNPRIPVESHSFVIPTIQNRIVLRPRFVGVNSFGYGGTNAHVVLEAVRENTIEKEFVRVERPLHILTLSAKNEKALKELASLYKSHITKHLDEMLPNVCFTANTGRSHFDHRLAIIAESSDSLCQQLDVFVTGKETARISWGKVKSQNRPKIAFLFTGQGSQYLGMGQQLYETQPTFRDIINRCDELLRPYLDKSLLSLLYSEFEESCNFEETVYVQPVLFSLEYALAQLWRSWGVEPDVVIGHSVGEYVAACIANVFSLEDGIRLIAKRSKLMGTQPRGGKMAVVFAEKALVLEEIAPYQDLVSIAAINYPKQTVISGAENAVKAVMQSLESKSITTSLLNVSHAFHSHLMEPVLDLFQEFATQIQFAAPCLPLVSNRTGRIFQPGEVPDASYWRSHLRESVLFYEGMQTLAANGCEIFLEIGPGNNLIGMGKRCLPKGTETWLTSLKKGQDDWTTLLESLKILYVNGLDVNWTGFDQNYPRHRVMLPNYPFQRRRCWLEPHEIKSYQTKN